MGASGGCSPQLAPMGAAWGLIRDVRISTLLYNSFLGPILKALGAIDQAIIMKKFNLSPFKSTFKGPLKSTFTQVFPKWTFLEWTLMDFNGPAPPPYPALHANLNLLTWSSFKA